MNSRLLSHIFFFFFLLSIHFIFAAGRSKKHPSMKYLTDDCLRCICLASSECDPAVRCHSVGPIDYYCGPYQVSRRYWYEAGSPNKNPDNPFDFEDCVNDIYCAIRTVKNYLKKNLRDCTKDQRITCEDFALIHKSGPNNCRKSWVRGTQFWQDFTKCADSLELAWWLLFHCFLLHQEWLSIHLCDNVIVSQKKNEYKSK